MSSKASLKEPSVAVKKALFALSGNRCAFPRCDRRMVDPDGAVRGEVCHIKGHRPEKSARFDPNQPAHERHGFYNLLVMCADHHAEIDKIHPELYSVELLQEWKKAAETMSGGEELDPAKIQIHVDDGGTAVISHNQVGGVVAGTVNILGLGLGSSISPMPSLDALHVLFSLTRANGSMRGTAVAHKNMRGRTPFDFNLAGHEHVSFGDPEHDARMFAAFESLERAGFARLGSYDRGRPTRVTIQTPGYEAAKDLPDYTNELWWRPVQVARR